MEKMDSTVDPCENFYQYACGQYDKVTSIPSHLNFVHILQQLQNDNTKFLKKIIEDTKLRDHYSKNSAISKLYQAYDICIDHSKYGETSISSFKKLIKTLGDSNITSNEWNKDNYNVFTAITKGMRLKFNLFFATGVWIDPKNSSRHVIFVEKPTFLLNVKSYIPKITPEDEQKRTLYRKYMITVLKNVAANPENVPAAVDEILKLEKRLAKIITRFSDSEKSSLTIRELSIFTKFNWLSFIQNLTSDLKHQASNQDILLVIAKPIIRHIINVIKTTEKHILSNFIAWKILQDSIPTLPSKISKIEQKFQMNTQRKSIEPKRWQTCVQILSEPFQKVLSYLYVEQKFSENAKRKAFEIFREIRKEFVYSLDSKTWIDKQTRTAAEEKANGIYFLVGYTNETKDIDSLNTAFQTLEINRSNFFETYLNQRNFVFRSTFKKLLHPVPKNSFEELTWNANAYYSRQENKISFLAGILQHPIYNSNNSRASNYGSLGMIVGHELTHGFDSRGYKYNKNGNRENWWTSDSLKNFQERTKCFSEQYNKFTVLGESVSGEKTLPENIADNGGVKLAYNAFKRNERENGKEPKLPGLNLSNDQIFFLSFAQIWCSKYTNNSLKEMTQNRLPMMFRVIGTLRNSVEFSVAYRCPVGSRMNPVKKCSLW